MTIISERPEKANAGKDKRRYRRELIRCAFVNVPRSLGKRPPLKHADPFNPTFVWLFECAMMLSVLNSARDEHRERCNAAALEYGSKIGAKQKEYCRSYIINCKFKKSRRRAPALRLTYTDMMGKRETFKPMDKVPETIDLAMRKAYRRKFNELMAQPPELIHVTVSSYHLLQQIGLSDNTDNLDWIERALDRLLDPIGGERIPLLHSYIQNRDGDWMLWVHGEWLARTYLPVMVPLPLKSMAGTALHYFASFVFGSNKESGMPPKRLYEYIGIEGRLKQALNRAVEAVNSNLARVDFEKLNNKYGKGFVSLETKTLKNGLIRLVCKPANDGERPLRKKSKRPIVVTPEKVENIPAQPQISTEKDPWLSFITRGSPSREFPK